MQCLLCDNGELILTSCYNKTFSLDAKIYQCSSCRSCIVQPLPDLKTLNNYYEQEWSNENRQMDMFTREVFNFVSCVHMRVKNYFRWPFIAPYLNKSRQILEIGAGNGTFSQFLINKGFNVSVIEPSQGFQKKLKKKNINIVGESLSDIPEKNSYDLIFMFHVLEHLRSPREALKKLHGRMKPGAFLLGEVPNVPYELEGLAKEERESIFNNVHLFHYSCEGLKKLFQKAGFSETKCFEIGFSDKGIRRLFPKANCHLIYPNFKAPHYLKLQSLFHIGEVFIHPTSMMMDKGEGIFGYQEPNDFISFKVKA